MISQPGIINVDYRIGGVPRYYLRFDERPFVQIPDTIRKCVAFIMYQGADKLHFAGTVFFVAYPDANGGEDYGHTYAVTAKHVIDAIREKTTSDCCYLRLNFLKARPDGKITEEIFIDLDAWFFHPTDSSVDVAVAPVSLPGADHLSYPIKAFATEEVIQKMGIGIGDDVFIAGLFPRHSGNKRNTPIIRAGNIAAMPEELINTPFSPDMTAYLVEVRSFGGLSGSPVFVHLGLVRLRDDKPGPWHFTKINATHYLLGLVHGHWDMPVPDTDEVVFDEAVRLAMNTGIAIVIPAEKILEVIDQPELMEMRKKRELISREQYAATMDALVESEEKKKKLFTKEDFEEALKKVSRVERPNKKKGE